jgi:hypothetical protein
VLQASNWGWLAPRASPIEPFGFALTPFVVGARAVVLAGSALAKRFAPRPLVRVRLLVVLLAIAMCSG